VDEKRPQDPHCFKCEGAHRLEDCQFLKDLPISERMSFAQRRGLCYGCFGVRHGAISCTRKKACGVNGCKLANHRLLHKESGVEERTVRSHAAHSGQQQIAFKMLRQDACTADGELVPVKILINEGRDSTLFCTALVRRLQLAVQKQTLIVEGVGGESTTHRNSEYLEMKLKTALGELVSIHGSTMPSITKPIGIVDWEKFRGRWAHLIDLPPIRVCGKRIDILIGLDHAALITPTESRFGRNDEPTASKTRLGWTLQGAVRIGNRDNPARVHRMITSSDVNQQLVEQVRRFCDTESFGTEFQADGMSSETRRAVMKLESELEKLPIGYAAPVLWKDGTPPVIPDSLRTAETRLMSLKNRFSRNPEYEKFYRTATEKNFKKGYAQRVSPEEVTEWPT
jgi:hypothetical protein